MRWRILKCLVAIGLAFGVAMLTPTAGHYASESAKACGGFMVCDSPGYTRFMTEAGALGFALVFASGGFYGLFNKGPLAVKP